LAASGTAFALRYIRASQAGIEIGFDWKRHCYFGTNRERGGRNANGRTSASRAMTGNDPKGCTIAGLNEMEMHGFSLIDTRESKPLTQIKG
jgi:pyrroline-5-carboxylate reductase